MNTQQISTRTGETLELPSFFISPNIFKITLTSSNSISKQVDSGLENKTQQSPVPAKNSWRKSNSVNLSENQPLANNFSAKLDKNSVSKTWKGRNSILLTRKVKPSQVYWKKTSSVNFF